MYHVTSQQHASNLQNFSTYIITDQTQPAINHISQQNNFCFAVWLICNSYPGYYPLCRVSVGMRAGRHRQAGPDLRAVLVVPGSTLSMRMLMLSHFHLYGELRFSGVMGRRDGLLGLRKDDGYGIRCLLFVCSITQKRMIAKCLNLAQGMTLGYPTSDIVLGLKGQRSRLGYSSLAWVMSDFKLNSNAAKLSWKRYILLVHFTTVVDRQLLSYFQKLMICGFLLHKKLQNSTDY